MRPWADIQAECLQMGEDGGYFELPSPSTGRVLRVIASIGEGWEHVSVSLNNRCPNWTEMELVARVFFNEDEYAIQLHVPPKEHVNCHPFCLHWWRPMDGIIPHPPNHLVGGGFLGS